MITFPGGPIWSDGITDSTGGTGATAVFNDNMTDWPTNVGTSTGGWIQWEYDTSNGLPGIVVTTGIEVKMAETQSGFTYKLNGNAVTITGTTGDPTSTAGGWIQLYNGVYTVTSIRIEDTNSEGGIKLMGVRINGTTILQDNDRNIRTVHPLEQAAVVKQEVTEYVPTNATPLNVPVIASVTRSTAAPVTETYAASGILLGLTKALRWPLQGRRPAYGLQYPRGNYAK